MVVITENRKEQLAKMPIIESKIFKSKDGEYVVHKTVVTDIKPIKYYEKVLESEAVPEEEVAA